MQIILIVSNWETQPLTEGFGFILTADACGGDSELLFLTVCIVASVEGSWMVFLEASPSPILLLICEDTETQRGGFSQVTSYPIGSRGSREVGPLSPF